MTLKEFMTVEGFRFKNFTWVNVKCDGVSFSIGADYILGKLEEEEIKEKYYPRTIRSIALIDLETISDTFYYDYAIELY